MFKFLYVASPKSAITISVKLLLFFIRIFSGFKSLCIIFCSSSFFNAYKTLYINFRASKNLYVPFSFIFFPKSPPWIKSNIK